MKKLFILTGESSGDKLASKVISDLKKINQNIEYLSVGGDNLKSLGVKSIYDLKEITYLDKIPEIVLWISFMILGFISFRLYLQLNF